MYVVVWRDNCPWCDRAKELLDQHKVEYIPVEFDPAMKSLFTALDLRTLPQIWHNTLHIGGFDNLKLFLET